jgi:hypothetical protein
MAPLYTLHYVTVSRVVSQMLALQECVAAHSSDGGRPNMALMAMAFPILPGKTDQWRRFAAELVGSRRDAYVASRQRLGVHERAFLQSTPQGDLVIVTLEGADPAAAVSQFGASGDPFTQWFRDQVLELHGFDLAQPMPGPIPDLVIDSRPG